MKRKLFGLLAVAISGLGLMLAGCDDRNVEGQREKAWESLGKNTWTVCYGSTRVFLFDSFKAGGVAAIPNDTGCAVGGKK